MRPVIPDAFDILFYYYSPCLSRLAKLTVIFSLVRLARARARAARTYRPAFFQFSGFRHVGGKRTTNEAGSMKPKATERLLVPTVHRRCRLYRCADCTLKYKLLKF
jgi:hypothetical protein